MGLADIADENVTGSGRKGRSVFAQEIPFSFNHCDTDLPFYVVGMNRKFLPRLEVEIDGLGRQSDFSGQAP
jgi:hypothetical protein